MGRVVFAIYKPFNRKIDALLEIVKQHKPLLLQENLVTSRPFIVLKTKNGSIIEIFEWKSEAAIEAAHSNKKIMEIWDAFSKVCTYETLQSLDEANSIFSDFEVLDF